MYSAVLYCTIFDVNMQFYHLSIKEVMGLQCTIFILYCNILYYRELQGIVLLYITRLALLYCIGLNSIIHCIIMHCAI